MTNLNDAFKAAFKGALFDSEDEQWHCAEPSPIGIVCMDRAISHGFGEGRIHEILGGWSSGKTAALYAWLINNQRRGGKSFLLEAEGAFDPGWWRQQGGIFKKKDPKSLLLKPVRTVEDAFEAMQAIISVASQLKEKVPIAIGLDSIAARGTGKLMKDGFKKKDMTKAFLMDQGTKLVCNYIQETRITIVATNQTRTGPGQEAWMETHTPGGRMWPFMSSARVELKFDGGPKGSKIFHDDEMIGRMIRGEIIKNKLGPPFKKFKLPIYTQSGFPHPEFGDRVTCVGVDRDEAQLMFLLSKQGVFGSERKRALTLKGAGRIHINPELTGGKEVKSFTRKTWPKVLMDYPHLLQFDPWSKIKKVNKK